MKNRFRSGEIGKSDMISVFIPKSMGFSQSLFGGLSGGDILYQKPNIIDGD